MSLDTDGPGEYERTMVVDARHLQRPSKRWKPWRLPRLERVSRADLRLREQLEWLEPPAEAVQALCERLQSILGTQVLLEPEGVQLIGPGELRRYLAEPTFLTFLAAGPHRARAVLEVELSLAHALVDTLLGGAGETVGLRPLTEIEEGVMSFVVLEALKALVPALGEGHPRPRLEGLGRGVEEAVGRVGEEEPVAAVHLRAIFGPQVGEVRLFIPSSLLEALQPGPDSERRRALHLARLESRLYLLGLVRCWLRADIGYAEISSQDLASLRAKDVVLMDALTARPDQGEPGLALLRLGVGRLATLKAEVFVEQGTWHARLLELVPGGQDLLRQAPSESDEAAAAELAAQEGEGGEEGYGESPRDNSQEEDEGNMEPADLLGDVPLQISVELARVSVTADQVVALRAGQVIELQRAPSEQVDLSVNGKVIARGELVEVEGQLGVRILSISG